MKRILGIVLVLTLLASPAWGWKGGGAAGNATQIQSKDIPAPEAGDDQKVIQYDHVSGDFQYVALAGGGTISGSGTPAANDIAQFTDATTIKGMTYAEIWAIAGMESAAEGVLDVADLQGFAAVLTAAEIGAAYDTEAELDALFAAKEDQLINEDGLYAALDDVDNFLQSGDTINDEDVDFDDADSNWTATTIGAALEELDNVINGGAPNDATGKVDWSQLVNVPAGFADGADASGSGGVNEAYSSGWDADTDAPEKDDVYDYLHQIDSDDDGSLTDETWFDLDNIAGTDEAGLYGLLSDVADFVQPAEVDVEMLSDVTGEGTAATYALMDDNDGTYSFRALTAGDVPAIDPDAIDVATGSGATDDDKIDQDNIEGFGASATPQWVFQDSDDAAGTADIYANSSGGSNDVIMTLGVEDSSGENTDYIEVDGVSETVDMLKPLVADQGVEITNAANPTVDAAGEIALDTDDYVIRVYNDSKSKGILLNPPISVTIIQPDDMDEDDDVPIFCNHSGMSYEILTINASADADDATFALVSAPYNDYSDETTIESITVSTDGTGVYTYTIGGGAGTDIDEGTVPNGECILFDPSADDLEWVNVTIIGYFIATVD
jgi:hypothetical protein